MQLENGFLSRRILNVLLFIFVAALAIVLVTSEQGVSGAMEWIGGLVARLFGQ
jgi:hypothetical protein